MWKGGGEVGAWDWDWGMGRVYGDFYGEERHGGKEMMGRGKVRMEIRERLEGVGSQSLEVSKVG